MKTDLYELVYTSVAGQGLSETELMVMLEHARIKNKRLGLTGMLVYDTREIMQLIEGEEADVKELYRTIQLDQRHTLVEIFYEGSIENRSFSNWSMAFKMLDEDEKEAVMVGYEKLDHTRSPINLIKEGPPNRGKETFLRWRTKL